MTLNKNCINSRNWITGFFLTQSLIISALTIKYVACFVSFLISRYDSLCNFVQWLQNIKNSQYANLIHGKFFFVLLKLLPFKSFGQVRLLSTSSSNILGQSFFLLTVVNIPCIPKDVYPSVTITKCLKLMFREKWLSKLTNVN